MHPQSRIESGVVEIAARQARWLAALWALSAICRACGGDVRYHPIAIPGFPGTYYGVEPTQINDSSVVTGSAHATTGGYHAFRWQIGADPEDLGVWPGGEWDGSE